jgi:hypothetical protein
MYNWSLLALGYRNQIIFIFLDSKLKKNFIPFRPLNLGLSISCNNLQILNLNV